jgi:hypothetical protein
VKKQNFDKKKTKLLTCKVKHRSYFIMKNVIENAGRKILLVPILFVYLSTNYLVTLTFFTVFLTVCHVIINKPAETSVPYFLWHVIFDDENSSVCVMLRECIKYRIIKFVLN